MNIHAQDPQFSQFYAAKLQLGPSFAGTTIGGRATLNFRDQWPQIPKEFVTYGIGIDQYLHNYRSGVGFLLFQDLAGNGNLASTSATIQYSYNFDITKQWQVRPGLQFSYVTRSVDYNKLLFGDQLTFTGPRPISIENLSKQRKGYLDFGTSLLAFSERSWIGASVDHIPSPNQTLAYGDSKVPLKYSFYGGIRFFERNRLLIKDTEAFSATFLYKTQGQYDQFDIGLYWTRTPIELGIWYRGLPKIKEVYSYLNHDAVIIKLGYFNDILSIGYSFDLTISQLRSYSGGAHEISLIYLFNQFKPAAKRKYKALPCPKF